MKQKTRKSATARVFTNCRIIRSGLFSAVFVCLSYCAGAQAVTGIITDYKGFWKTGLGNINPIKPDNSHNVLAFSYNGVQYSTGVNDALLSQKGEQFVPGDFWALPVDNLSSGLTSNTKVGFGALYDGIFNGPSLIPPAYGISTYLTDGIKGLNIGTCVANLPAGSLTFVITNIQASSIGDGIPDIIVTQIADPSGSYDRYEFTDNSGNRIGNYKDIVFTNINPIANWTADFYEARLNPLSLLGGFTQTDRPMRLWAADLSEFGVTRLNYSQIRSFKINLSGQSDVAFVAYNNKSVNFQNALPVQYSYLKGALKNNTVKLNWQTLSEQHADRFVVERSNDGSSFRAIGTVKATNSSGNSDYEFTDASPLPGKSYYRLKQYDADGTYTLSSTIVRIINSKDVVLQAYPNPARGTVYLEHAAADGTELITVYNVSGSVVKQQAAMKDEFQTRLDISQLTSGTYYVSFGKGSIKTSTRFLIN